jgi:hypothetical protein
MGREPFFINPVLEAYIHPLSDEEERMLEESILAEGCRDPLVVWREENVLVDGHHRKKICERHGLSFQVAYRSFPDMEAAKAWMDLNQLGRRNLSREQRDEMIRRLAASGVRQKDIAEKTGLSKQRVGEIVNPKSTETGHVPAVNSISATDELEALRRQLEEAEGRAKKNEALVREERANADRQARELTRALNEAQAKAKQVEVREVEVRVPVESPEALAKIAELKQAIDAKDQEIATLGHAGKSVEKLTRERDQLRKEIDQAKRDNERSLTEARANAAFQDALRCAGVFSAAVEAIERMARDGMLYVEHMTSARQLLRNVAGTATHGMSVLDSCDAETRSGNVISLHEARGGGRS